MRWEKEEWLTYEEGVRRSPPAPLSPLLTSSPFLASLPAPWSHLTSFSIHELLSRLGEKERQPWTIFSKRLSTTSGSRGQPKSSRCRCPARPSICPAAALPGHRRAPPSRPGRRRAQLPRPGHPPPPCLAQQWPPLHRLSWICYRRQEEEKSMGRDWGGDGNGIG